MIALSVQSCRTVKESVQGTEENHLDSLVSEIRLLKATPVPQEKVKLAIPTTHLLDLPAGASFTGRNGRANVSISRDRDTIRIYAVCDSIQALCEYYERELTRIRGDTRTEEARAEYSTGIYSPFSVFFTGLFAGIILTLATVILIKIKK